MENIFKVGDIVSTKRFGCRLQVNQLLPNGMVNCIYKKDEGIFSVTIHESLLKLTERI